METVLLIIGVLVLAPVAKKLACWFCVAMMAIFAPKFLARIAEECTKEAIIDAQVAHINALWGITPRKK